MNLRPYQVTALESIWMSLQCEQAVLLEAACSAGKTLLFSKITQRLLAENPSFRVLILMDREILVSQTHAKLLTIAPELALSVGIVCASVSDTKTLHRPVTIASRQSLINHLGRFEAVNLIIVDECHLMAVPKEGQTEPPDQFGAIIQTLRGYNPRTRLLGVTASPYRLSDGYIYGDKNVKGALPYFETVHHQVTVAELQAAGYLAPLKGKTIVVSDLASRLANVSLVGGEFNLGAISNIMSEGIHIRSAVEAWKEYASDRKKTIAFCVTIAHAEKMAEAFNSEGISAVAIHSEQDDLTAYANMEALKNGDGKVFCSVAKLTTGMDVPDIDCILMARPTKSAALYKQILGRGQRIAPDKTDCLILDLVGNNSEFGTDLDRLKVHYKKGATVDGKQVVKTCPQCEADIHPACRVCPDCGYEYPQADFEEAAKPDMVDATYGAEPPKRYRVDGMYPSLHTSKGSKKKLLRLRLEMENNISGSLWLCFSEDGYTGFAVEKGQMLWEKITGRGSYPLGAEAALHWEADFKAPDYALVDMNGRWPEIRDIIYDGTETPPAQEIPDYDDIPF